MCCACFAGIPGLLGKCVCDVVTYLRDDVNWDSRGFNLKLRSRSNAYSDDACRALVSDLQIA